VFLFSVNFSVWDVFFDDGGKPPTSMSFSSVSVLSDNRVAFDSGGRVFLDELRFLDDCDIDVVGADEVSQLGDLGFEAVTVPLQYFEISLGLFTKFFGARCRRWVGSGGWFREAFLAFPLVLRLVEGDFHLSSGQIGADLVVLSFANSAIDRILVDLNVALTSFALRFGLVVVLVSLCHSDGVGCLCWSVGVWRLCWSVVVLALSSSLVSWVAVLTGPSSFVLHHCLDGVIGESGAILVPPFGTALASC